MDELNDSISVESRSIRSCGALESGLESFGAFELGRWQVSRLGGTLATWRPDGKEIVYLGCGGIVMASEVRTEGSFDVGTPNRLFKAHFRSATGRNYDITPDGQRFRVNGPKESDHRGQSLTLVLNWPAALRK